MSDLNDDDVTPDFGVRRDPIQHRLLCRSCWVGGHQQCEHGHCTCLCQTVKAESQAEAELLDMLAETGKSLSQLMEKIDALETYILDKSADCQRGHA